MDREHTHARDLYAALLVLYAGQNSPPLSHMWNGSSAAIGHIRKTIIGLGPPALQVTSESDGDFEETSGRDAVVETEIGDDALVARSIELSMRWYADHFAARGIDTRSYPPLVVPTGGQIRNAIRQQNPVIALGRYEHFHTTLLLERECLSTSVLGDKDRVLYVEIGAIYGSLSQILAPRHRNMTYVFVDIPESLCITWHMVASHHRNAKIFFATRRGDIKHLNWREFDFIFCPALLLEELAAHPIDIFAGFHTFGEMHNEAIAHYFNLIQDHLTPTYFVSRNRFGNFIDPAHWYYLQRLDENMGSVLCDDRWTTRHWDMEPEILKCPFVDTRRHPRYLEFILERAPPASQKHQDEAKAKYLHEVMAEGWVAIVSQFENMLYVGYKSLRHDLTRTGTLFRTWESIRMSPGRDNILVMLHYLDYLSASAVEFAEEWFFYAATLRKLHELAPDATSQSILNWLEMRCRCTIRDRFAPAPAFRLGVDLPPERLPVSEVRKIMYQVAKSNVGLLTKAEGWTPKEPVQGAAPPHAEDIPDAPPPAAQEEIWTGLNVLQKMSAIPQAERRRDTIYFGRSAPVGISLYGPYLSLRPGRYSVAMFVECSGLDKLTDGGLRLDVACQSGDQVIAVLDLPVMDLRRLGRICCLEVEFDLSSCVRHEQVEFRMWRQAPVAVEVFRVVVNELPTIDERATN